MTSIAVSHRPLQATYTDATRMDRMEQIMIRGYEDRFAADFARLNREWLEGFGLLEEADLKYLDHPRESILDHGGEIFVAVDGELVVGACAVLRIDHAVVELAKLSVAPDARGRGIGRRLTLAAIAHAQSLGAERVVLVSNSQLAPAIRLYESLGFRHAPLPANTGYATADVWMELSLVNPLTY
jgi:ribosomal protein S18 acetylase RimI-like enzyme